MNNEIALKIDSASSTSDLSLQDASATKTSGTQITKYEDVAPHIEVVRPQVTPDSLWVGTNTLPNQELGVVLSRSYQIAQVVWSNQALHTDIAGFSNVDVPVTLMAIPQIAEKIAYYAYFRFKAVRLTIRINATPWHYGCLALSSTVNNSHAWHNMSTTVWLQYYNNNCVLMDANSGVDVDYVIPWASQKQWISTRSPDTHLCTFRMTVAKTLSMLGTTLVNAQITVFASFVDPEVCFPIADSVSVAFLEGFESYSSRERKNKEARTKTSNQSMVSDVREVLDTTFSVVDNVGEMVSKFGPLLALMDKPTSLMPLQHVTILPGTSMPHMTGLDTAVKLSADPEASAGFSPGSMGDSIGNPTISSLVQTPSVVTGFAWTNATAAGTLLLQMPLYPGLSARFDQDDIRYVVPSYMAWFSSMFRYWRGSMKILIHFIGSAFITSRLRIVWIPPGFTPPATLTANETGDYVSEVIEVTGSMDHTFSIPWVSQLMYRRRLAADGYLVTNGANDGLFAGPTDDADEATTLGSLCVYLVNALVSVESALTPTVTALVFAAGGEDMQFSNVGNVVGAPVAADTYIGESAVPAFESHTAINKCFGAPFKPLIPGVSTFEFGLATSETVNDLVSVGKRYSVFNFYPQTAGSSTYEFLTSVDFFKTAGTLTVMPLQQWLTCCHVNFRGSVRHKIFWYSSSAVGTSTASVTAPFSDPASSTRLFDAAPTFVTSNDGSNNFLEFELPYNAQFPWYYRGSSTEFQDAEAIIPATDANVLTPIGKHAIAFGDDFAVGMLQCPPGIIADFTVPSEKNRTRVATSPLPVKGSKKEK